MKIAFFSTKSYDRAHFDKANDAFGFELSFYEPSLKWETRALAQGFDAVCVFVNDKLDAALLAELHGYGIKTIALRCAGFNNVDVKRANELGLQVVRVPAYSPHAVAEHAVALILTLNRKTHKAYNRVRENNFSLERLEGFDLYGKTVGVIGTGKIGGVFAGIMKGFGCKVLAYDPYPDTKLGLEYASLDELLSASDIVSLHCPLTPQTYHIINEASIDKMKQGLMLINTSRGGLIDTYAVIQALKHGKIAYLGIDVYEQEEALFFQDLSELIIQDDLIARLMSFPNVLITAHQAFFTENALNQIADTTLHNLYTLSQGTDCPNTVKI